MRKVSDATAPRPQISKPLNWYDRNLRPPRRLPAPGGMTDWFGVDMPETTRPPRPCSVEGCHRTNPKSSMCSTHQMRATRAKKRFTITCAHCGQDAQVGSRPDQKYCSAACRRAEAKARRESPRFCSVEGCDRLIHRRGLMCGTHHMRRLRGEKKYTITCAHCNRTASVDRPGAQYCSLSCSTLNHNIVRRQARELTRRARLLPVPYTGPPFKRPEREVPHVHGRARWRTGQCRICTKWYTHWNVDVTCSPDCQRELHRDWQRMARGRRRALKKDAFVANVYRRKVFEADGYRCHLCNRKTDPTKQAPHPRAPTLDHVIPLARGGTHEPANVRTACFLCNCLKSDRGGGEQFALAL